jgi:hypothetical protein
MQRAARLLQLDDVAARPAGEFEFIHAQGFRGASIPESGPGTAPGCRKNFQ